VEEFLFLEGEPSIYKQCFRNPHSWICFFLAEIIGSQEESGKRKRKGKEDELAGGQEPQPTFLDKFIQGPKNSEAEEAEETGGVIMNEDGAHTA
jgi:hypothetical protein